MNKSLNNDNTSKIEYNKSIKNNNDLIVEIISIVSKNIKRNLQNGEQKQVISFINKIDNNLLKSQVIDKTKKIIIKTLTDEFIKNTDVIQYPRNYENMKEILNTQIGISSDNGISHSVYDNPSYNVKNNTKNNDDKLINLFGIKSSSDAARILNPKSMYKKNHIILDSKYRITDGNIENRIKTFAWYYIQNSQNTSDGSVNIIGNVRDIIGFRIYPFRIPYTNNADNQYAKISLSIEEVNSQSFIAHEGRRFHFMLDASIDTNFINLDANVYNGFFWFEKPITTLDKISISFGNPLESIIFDNDRDFCSFDYFLLPALTKIKTHLIHKLKNGDRVYFTNFTTGPIDPLLVDQNIINNNIINNINNINGFLITVINLFEFSIDYNSSLIQNPILNLKCNVYYGSKRIFIPFEIIYINPI